MKSLGIDVGTDSLGLAWVDTDKQEIIADVRIFAPGIDEKKKSKNEGRRRARSLRRLLRRRAARKWRLRCLLQEHGFLPDNPAELARALGACKRDDEANYDPERLNPWVLRSEAMSRRLSTYEVGRVLVHLNQRRGYREGDEERELRQLRDEQAQSDGEGNETAKRQRKKQTQTGESEVDKESGKVKAGLSRLEEDMKQAAAKLGVHPEELTYGQFMADLHLGPTCSICLENGGSYHEPIRNRLDSHRYHAPRELIIREFHAICDAQAGFGHELLASGHFVRDSIEKLIFFQHRTYWKRRTLRRCDLVPTDERVFKADRHAQEFRLLETVNRMKIGTGKSKAPLAISDPRRQQIITFLSTQTRPQLTTLLEELNLKRGSINLEDEKGEKMPLNSDWFSATIIHGVFGHAAWAALSELSLIHI